MPAFMRRLAAVPLLIGALTAPGCFAVAVAAGAAAVTYGAIRYTDNEAYRDCPGSLDETWKVALAALKDNGYDVDQSTPHAATEGRMKISDVEVWVDSQPGGVSRVHVRVGAFGTEDEKRRAALILESVGKRLA
jgi:hypothetical protein